MMMNYLNKTTWEEIKINEVFAIKGCWLICWKDYTNSFIVLADDNTKPYMDITGTNYCSMDLADYPNLYKLSKPTQKLWREDGGKNV